MAKIVKPLIIASSFLLSLAPSIILASQGASTLEKLYRRAFSHQNNSKKAEVNLLFIQQAAEGNFAPLYNKKGCYRLTLSHLNQHVVYFSDQPKRLTGRISVEKFLNIWEHNKSQYGIKPNVAIQAIDAVSGKSKDELSVVSVLSDPKYDLKNQTLTYTACIFGQGKSQKLAAMRLKSINLFFDPFHPWPP